MTNYNELSREELIAQLEKCEEKIVILENLIQNISCPICKYSLSSSNHLYHNCCKCSQTTCGDCGTNIGCSWICDNCFTCKNCKQRLTLNINCDIYTGFLCYTCSPSNVQ